MEHLGDNLLNARHGLNKVRLFADLQPTIEGSFHTLHTFPGPLGWIVYDHGRVKPSQSNLDIATEANGRPNRSLTKFVQRWLWFEVLRGILGHLPDFDLHDFVREDLDDIQLVTTTKLPGYLRRWREFEMQNSNWRRQLQALLILEQAQFYVSHFCAVSNDQKNPTWSIDQKVALSIMVLGETLTTALIRIQQAIKFKVRGWHNHNFSTQGWGYSSAVLETLQHAKVCPNKIYMLKALFHNNTIGLLYALQLLPQPAPGELHDRCDAKHCEAVQCYLPRATGHQSNTPLLRRDPEPIHCDDCDGSCKQVGPDPKELNRIIQQDKIPLLQYNENSGTVNLIEMSQSIDKQYVVFSHVWADGYGNPNANVLNQCVLKLFVQLFAEIRASKNHPPALAPEHFWIDTLAIPVQAEYKDQRKKAIRSMHHIYTGAKYTIVLDAGLMGVSRGEGYAQAAMSISVSKWMTRLWTLQEAVLSKELYFKFSDDIISMDRLEALFPKESALLHSIVAFASRTYYHGIMKRESQAIHGPVSNLADRSGFVAAAWKALQWRTTAHLQHETLALATLLNVDTDDFADSSNTKKVEDGSRNNERMQKLLDLLSACKPCPIPPGIIFLPGPRLLEKGYRWAPQTWLSSCPVEPPDPLTLKCPKAKLNRPHGLEVRFPGFLLDRPSTAQGLFADDNEFYFPTGLSLGHWYRILRADEEAERRDDRKLAIIVPQLPVINPREIALLVAIERQADDIFYVEILHRVWINEVSDPGKIKGLKQKFLTANGDSLSWGEIISDGDYWCVDGPEAPQPIDEPDDNDSNFGSWLVKRSKTWR